MKTRRVIALTMFISFIMMAYTGVMLFLAPHGRVAYWTGWHLLGLDKTQYGEVHTTAMLVFLVTGIWHTVLNWKPIVNYLRNKSRKITIFRPEFNLALGINVVFLVGTLAGFPPFSSFLNVSESIKDYWEERSGPPPWGHAEANTIARFTRGLVNWERLEHDRQVTLTVEEALAALRAADITVESETALVIDIANANGTTPQAIMEILRRAERPLNDDERTSEQPGEQPQVSSGPFRQPASGLGRLTLRSYCERYHHDLARVTALLSAEGPVDVDQRLRDLATDRGTDPEGIVDLLNERASAAGEGDPSPATPTPDATPNP